jgi:ribose/xylose/arabinose/galactoside ABC-type transport system permease subunit
MSLTETMPLAPRKWLSRQVIISAVILAAILLGLWIVAPNFFRYNNIVNVLLQASLLGMLAIGMAVIMIVGGIDLSLPANMAMSAVLGAFYMKATGDWGTASLIMMTTGVLIGLVNGFAVAKLKMIPFVVTLAMMTIVSGTTVWMTNSLSISQLPEGFVSLFGARPFFRIPITVIIVAILSLLVAMLMRSSVAGRWAYAVGINEKAARVARVPISRVVMASYVFGGLMAGLTAILLTARLGAASANMGNDGVVLDIVSACVVGGISIYGGAGRVGGALFGALLITLLSNAMNLIGVSFYLSLVIKGVVIVAFVAADSRRGVKQ